MSPRVTAALALLVALIATGCRFPGRRRKVRQPGAPRHVVVLVPGWASGAEQMKPIAETLHKYIDVETHRIELTGLGITKGLPTYGQELADYVKRLGLKPEDRLDLVGFSFGGLVCRWYVEQLGGRAGRIVTICTPHHGTTKAARLKLPSVQDMQPGSGAMKKLCASRRADVAYHSIRLAKDTTIRPSFSPILEGASNYQLPGKAHLMGPYRGDVRKTIVAIFTGRARPGGPQKLTSRQKAELRLPPERSNAP